MLTLTDRSDGTESDPWPGVLRSLFAPDAIVSRCSATIGRRVSRWDLADEVEALAASSEPYAPRAPRVLPGEVTLADLARRLGLARSTLAARVRAGTFPPPARPAAGCRPAVWRLEDLHALVNR